jgi:hypothetical protein
MISLVYLVHVYGAKNIHNSVFKFMLYGNG